jgi:hypothetical protein
MLIWLQCKDCDSVVEVYCDGDNPTYCVECLSIDNFKDIEDE